jgi:hypothetical protein
MARRPIEEIRRLKEETDRREQELIKLSLEQNLAFARSPEGQAWLEKQRAVNTVAAPIPQSLALFMARLTPEQWDSLRAGEVLVFSSDPQPGELPLPPETVGRLHAAPFIPALPGIRVETPPGFGPGDPTWDRMKQDWASASGYRIGIRLNEQSGSTGAFFLEVNAAPLGGPSDPFQFGPGAGLMLAVSPVEATSQLTENTPERRAQWAADPILSRQAAFKPAAPPRPAGLRISAFRTWQFRDLLPEIARAYEVQFISDAYWDTVKRGGNPPTTASMPLYQFLDGQVGFAERWDRKDDLIRLRSRSWYFERPREIPLRFVRRLRESYEKEGGLSIDEILEMVTQLRDSQLHQLPELTTLGALPRGALDLLNVIEARYALRLYASLSRSQQQTLVEGRPLRLTELLPSQRELYVRAVRVLQRLTPMRPLGLPVVRKLTPEDWQSATLGLSVQRVQRRAGAFGGPGGFGPPPAPAGGGSGGAPPASPAPLAGPFPPGAPGPASGSDAARRPVEEWEFAFQVGSGVRQSLRISAVAKTTSSEAGKPGAGGAPP